MIEEYEHGEYNEPNPPLHRQVVNPDEGVCPWEADQQVVDKNNDLKIKMTCSHFKIPIILQLTERFTY
jgi:hypothetical protein